MSFSKYIIITVAVYIVYYAVNILIDLVKGNIKQTAEEGTTIDFQFEKLPEPKRARIDTNDELDEESGGRNEKFENQGEEILNDDRLQESYKNLGVDLTLETVSHQNSKSAASELRKIGRH